MYLWIKPIPSGSPTHHHTDKAPKFLHKPKTDGRNSLRRLREKTPSGGKMARRENGEETQWRLNENGDGIRESPLKTTGARVFDFSWSFGVLSGLNYNLEVMVGDPIMMFDNTMFLFSLILDWRNHMIHHQNIKFCVANMYKTFWRDVWKTDTSFLFFILKHLLLVGYTDKKIWMCINKIPGKLSPL